MFIFTMFWVTNNILDDPDGILLNLPILNFLSCNVKTISQSPSPQAASLCETSDRLPRGMRTYARYTELDRLQTILMTVSSTPLTSLPLCGNQGPNMARTPTDDNASLIWLTSTLTLHNYIIM